MRWLRRWHRLFGILLGVPCLLWGISGAFLSWKNYATLSRPGNPQAVTGERTPFTIGVQQALAATGQDGPPQSVEWRWLLGSPRYVVHYADGPAVLIDGRSGELVPKVDEALARRIAQADAPSGVRVLGCALQERATLIYRPWEEFPAYRLPLSNGDEVYVSPRTGEVLAHVDGMYRLIRGSFVILHTLDLSTAPGRHASYLLLALLGLGLLFLSVTGLLLAYRTYRPGRRGG
jgi:uncharacterized iron-regulated membrane protein